MKLNNSSFECRENSSNIYIYNQVTPVPEKQTTITFTGKQVGTTSVIIGTTMYRITVLERGGNDTASVKVGSSVNISIPDTIGTDETAVSYTHLDVYKRQEQICLRTGSH